MKIRYTCFIVFVVVVLLFAANASAQMIPREDVTWARTTASPITVDGVLSEPAWAAAESLNVMFGQNAGLPGSGFHFEGTPPPSDPTNATLKFLVEGDSLYVAIILKDSSIGSGGFNRFDGFLMNVRYKQPTGHLPTPARPNNPTASFEYFYIWWDLDTNTLAVGALPQYFGWAGGHRDSVQGPNDPYAGMVKRLIWDAATTVQGVTNSDTTASGAFAADTGYVVELKYNLALKGYDVGQSSGDIIMYSIQIYDVDWQWPPLPRLTGNRVWLQNPWGNTSNFNHMRVFVRPDVTISSGPVPTVPADVTIGNAQNYAAPTVDGALTEPVWQDAPSFRIQYGNAAIRNTYPNTGKYRSGHMQSYNSGASVLEPSIATVKWFFKEDTLYFGFDVNDQVVQYVSNPNRYDGFRVTINDRVRLRTAPNNLFGYSIRFFVDSTGAAGRDEDTPALIDSSAVRVALQLKPNTTVDTSGLDIDQGYTAELAIVLTEFGYPPGRGDGVVFPAVSYYDGDSFTPFTDSYGTRTWWFRDAQDGDGPPWAYMDPNFIITDVKPGAELPETYALLGSFPNPFNPTTTIRYLLPEPSSVTLDVYNILGQLVRRQVVEQQQPGEQQVVFNAAGLSSGVYAYRLRMAEPGTSVERAAFMGKMVLLK